jgi:hypothetical protein
MALNVRADRMALHIYPTAVEGDPLNQSAFFLTHLIISGEKDKVFPVRGSLI